MSGQNIDHGHVHPRPDGAVARCGGPALCIVCREEERVGHPLTDAEEKSFIARWLRETESEINARADALIAAKEAKEAALQAQSSKADTGSPRPPDPRVYCLRSCEYGALMSDQNGYIIHYPNRALAEAHRDVRNSMMKGRDMFVPYEVVVFE